MPEGNGEIDINIISSSKEIIDPTKAGAVKRKASQIADKIGLHRLAGKLNPDREIVFDEPPTPIDLSDIKIDETPPLDPGEIKLETDELEMDIGQQRDSPRRKDRLAGNTILVGERENRPEFEQVVFEPEAIDHTTEHLRSGAGSEMGGVLIGHFCEDTRTGKKFTKVEGFIPRRRVDRNAVAINFTPGDWAEMNLELDRKNDQSGADQVVVGWVHSHPANSEVAPQSDSANNQEGGYGDRNIMRNHFPDAKFITMIYGVGGRYDNQYSIWRNFEGTAKRQNGFEITQPADPHKYSYYSALSEL